MGLRPGHCYSDVESDRAFTRVAISVPRKNFIGTNPALKIRQFNMGNPLRDYDTVIDVCVKEKIQMRDNAIEAARTAINRTLTKWLGRENFFMKVRVYPFHILRENKQAQGAGADRVSQGMSHAFGKPIGRAARLKKGQTVLSILVNKKDISVARKAILRAKAKFPVAISLEVHQDTESIGTRPKKVRIEEEKVEEKKEEAKEEGKEAVTEKAKKEEGSEAKTAEKAKETTKT